MNFNSKSSSLLLLIALCFAITASVSCDNKRPEKEFITFEELQDPTNDVNSDWSDVPSGLQSSFISIDIKAPKSVAPQLDIRKNEKVIGWKGEKTSAQLLLWTAKDVNQVELEFSDFKSES